MTETGDESSGIGGYSNVSALVVAGGLSTRFGSDKVFTHVRAKPMLHHVYDTVCEVASEVVISVRPDHPQALNATYVVDRVSGVGPLAGLEAGIAAATRDWVLTVAGDMPMLCADDVRALLGGRHESAQAVVAVDATGQLQPLCACYHRSVRPIISQMLDEGEHAVHTLLDRITYRTVMIPDASLANINEPADLDNLL